MKAFSILIFLTVLIGSSLAQNVGNSTGVDASDNAQELSSVYEQPATEGATMDALDVLHKVDGTEVAGRLTEFSGTDFTVDVQGQVELVPRAEIVSIALGQSQLRPKLLYVGSDTDDLANSAVGDALKKAGFDVTSATRLPASLEGYDVVVLESASASSPDAAKMLRSFVGKGGGAVLVGQTPWGLCPEGESDYYWGDDTNGYSVIKFYPWDTSEVADWGGGSTVESAQGSSPRIAASIANPFFACPDINVGEELYVFEGDIQAQYFVIGSL